jgi:hypothetical protein
MRLPYLLTHVLQRVHAHHASMICCQTMRLPYSSTVIGLCEDGTVDDYPLFLASVYRVFILVLVAIVALSASDIRIDFDHGLGVLGLYLLDRGNAEMLSTFHLGGLGDDVLNA